MSGLEIWGGAECTVNRHGDIFRDQLLLTGHDRRAQDFDRMADLGLRACRFPVLWERIAPERPDERQWGWTDDRLSRLRNAGIRPIAGLVHHGSGPRYTSLVDEGFAPALAEYALSVARRYPWIEEWTPVNEPLTTARFSALYGHWYPHARDERLFWMALLNEIEGVKLAMQAVRTVNPGARLIQTDDLGRTWATAICADQAAFDNSRRWLTWDLLTGRVNSDHDFWKRICSFGFEDRLRALLDDPCPPDVIGINHYLTSDRFLDHRLQRYPPATHGGNGTLAYADVEAVRVLKPGASGVRGALAEAWDRYRLPLAITEVHNGCSRDEQLRWTREAWQIARDLRDEGVDVRAVTAWALFGSQGWNTLLTGDGIYEPGAFDVRGPEPRETAIAKLLKELTGQDALHPAAAGPGWWSRDIRIHHPPAVRPAPMREHPRQEQAGEDRRAIVIIGATGTLGRALAAACNHRGLPFRLTARHEIDLSDPASIERGLDRHRPWAVLNAAGWVRVDDAEHQPDACIAANADGAIALAQACERRGIATVNFSSDLVFGGGRAAGPYRESDAPSPLNVYGESKSRMEQGLTRLDGDHLIIRTAAFFSPYDQFNFAVHAAQALRRQQPFVAASDYVVTPTYVPDLCDATLDLLIDGERGIWHLSNMEAVSWHEFAVRLADACGLDRGLVRSGSAEELGWKAPRPANAALLSERGSPMPPLQAAIERFARLA